MYTFIISTRLEFMRYIYNAETSPTMMSASMGPPYLTGTLLNTSMCGSITSTTSAPLLLNSLAGGGDTHSPPNHSSLEASSLPEPCSVGSTTNTQSELLQCITNCANASRLSLANLFPSRFEQTRFISQRPTNLLNM